MTEQANEAVRGRHYKGATIAWGNGEMYDFDNPNPEIISLIDAAYALAYTVRWRGQTFSNAKRMFYGVAQHCVFGAEEMLEAGLGAHAALCFLCHEDDEVVLPDFPGPIKQSCPDFKPLAKRQGEALRRRFRMPDADPVLMKRWDLRMLITEKRDLLRGHEHDRFHDSSRVPIDEDDYQPFQRRIVPYAHPDEAAWAWMNLYRDLGGKE